MATDTATLTRESWTREEATARYDAVRARSLELCEPLEPEDYVVQSMPDVSPTKWHLAHTTWFFEEFLLAAYLPKYQPFREGFDHLFNSYYQTAKTLPFDRPRRGLLSRPTVREVESFRAHVDTHLRELISTVSDEHLEDVLFRLTIGLHHEQQHQELLLMDIKHVLSVNPLRPCYRAETLPPATAPALSFDRYEGGTFEVGHGGGSFAFDNETPRHPVLLQDFELANRCVTNGEYLEFIEAGGYDKPEIWLADGWTLAHEQSWSAPMYWDRVGGTWHQYTLHGFEPIDENEPVVHVSYYEADAYATWAGRRLPTEFEWEIAASRSLSRGTLADGGIFHPRSTNAFFGDVWEMTQSPYAPYPGFRPLGGTLGEYNGKFMANQFVVRGACAVTPDSHVRTTYRNFFYPHMRWAFQGIRLAGDP